jgi:hypothetical protein
MSNFRKPSRIIVIAAVALVAVAVIVFAVNRAQNPMPSEDLRTADDVPYSNDRYGFSLTLKTADNSAMVIEQEDTAVAWWQKFAVSFPSYRIGTVARIDIFPIPTAGYPAGYDEPYIFLGENKSWLFYLRSANDLPLPDPDDTAFREAARAFERIRDAFERGEYEFAVYDPIPTTGAQNAPQPVIDPVERDGAETIEAHLKAVDPDNKTLLADPYDFITDRDLAESLGVLDKLGNNGFYIYNPDETAQEYAFSDSTEFQILDLDSQGVSTGYRTVSAEEFAMWFMPRSAYTYVIMEIQNGAALRVAERYIP